jgi:hypothetical protein
MTTTLMDSMDRAVQILRLFPEEAKASDIGEALLLALAINSVCSKNPEHTLVEHFDGVREAYVLMFKLIQSTGVEQLVEQHKRTVQR